MDTHHIMAPSTFVKARTAVAKGIVDEFAMSNLFAQWVVDPGIPIPAQACLAFNQMTQPAMPGCVGAIDGWACCVLRPRARCAASAKPFFHRVHYFALNVQAMADDAGRFLWVDIHGAGGTHDSTHTRSRSSTRSSAAAPWTRGPHCARSS